MRRLVGLALVGLLGAVPFEATAQAPGPPPCEDTLRAVRILAEQYAASRQRTEIEAAQTMANLLKQIDLLRGQVQVLEAEKKVKAGKEGK